MGLQVLLLRVDPGRAERPLLTAAVAEVGIGRGLRLAVVAQPGDLSGFPGSGDLETSM